MHYLLLYETAADYLQRRPLFRDEHLRLAWASHDRGELMLAGALEGTNSAALLFKGDSAAVAENFAQADPYVRHGLVTSWRVHRWLTVAGDTAAAPVKPAE